MIGTTGSILAWGGERRNHRPRMERRTREPSATHEEENAGTIRHAWRGERGNHQPSMEREHGNNRLRMERGTRPPQTRMGRDPASRLCCFPVCGRTEGHRQTERCRRKTGEPTRVPLPAARSPDTNSNGPLKSYHLDIFDISPQVPPPEALINTLPR